MNRKQFLALSMASLLIPKAFADDGGQIRIILGYPPGASGDAITRQIAERMSASLGVTVIVDNHPGAGGRIALDYVKNATPDGKTIILTPSSPMTSDPWLYKLNFDPVKDFEPIAYVTNFRYAYAINIDTPAKNLAEYIALAKADPKYRFFSAVAPGGGAHMAVAALSEMTKVPMTFVPYKGSSNALIDLLGGRLGAFMATVADVVALKQQGKVRVLAVTSPARSPFLPDVPTFDEQGFNIEASGWYGVYAPAKTPAATLTKLSNAVVGALHDPSLQAIATKLGMEAVGLGAADLAKIQKQDYEAMGRLIKSSGFEVKS